jgi:hypothetical protein
VSSLSEKELTVISILIDMNISLQEGPLAPPLALLIASFLIFLLASGSTEKRKVGHFLTQGNVSKHTFSQKAAFEKSHKI